MLDEQLLVAVIVAAFWVASNSNVKVVAVGIPNVFDQVLGVPEPSRGGLPLFLFSWWITSQCEDICAAGVVCLFQCLVYLGLGHVGAGKMHQRLQTIH